MSTVLVTGGTGLIGKHLCHKLKEAGYDVAILSQVRYNKSDFPIFYWNWQKEEIDEIALKNSEYIIHLAGAQIANQRWTPERKRLIVDSRVKSAEFLHRKIKELHLSPKAFISASAVGYYGMTTEKKVWKESDLPSDDFLGVTCQKWEQAAAQAYDPRIRTVQLRTGVVLTPQGGALSQIALPIKMGVGAPLGNGKQSMPWIHIDDLCALYIQAIRDVKMNGAYNAVAPENHTNRSLTKIIAKVLNKPIWIPRIPALGMKLVYGEMARMLLYGSPVSSKKVLATGFSFQYPTLEAALENLLPSKG